MQVIHTKSIAEFAAEVQTIIDRQANRLRTLARGVLDAHTYSCEKCPENIDRGCSGQDVGCNVNCCQCEACKLAREVFK